MTCSLPGVRGGDNTQPASHALVPVARPLLVMTGVPGGGRLAGTVAIPGAAPLLQQVDLALLVRDDGPREISDLVPARTLLGKTSGGYGALVMGIMASMNVRSNGSGARRRR